MLKLSNLLLYFINCILFSLCYLYLPIGIYSGSDWTIPASLSQVKIFHHPYTWNSGLNFGSTSIVGVVGVPFTAVFKFLIQYQITDILHISKNIVIFLVIFSFNTMYIFLRCIKLNKYISVLGGFLYICSPTFFNYIPMGWIYALFAMGIFPLFSFCVIKAMEEDNIVWILIAALCWYLATLQSQSIIWVPIILISLSIYLIDNKERLRKYFYCTILLVIIYVLLNSYWILPLILFNDVNITNTKIIFSSPSMGADSVFYPQNAIRMFGGLFNQQYETIIKNVNYDKIFWLIPIICISTLVFSRGKLRLLALSMSFNVFILLLIIFFFRENRDILSLIPGSGLIRHLGRFSTVNTFGFVVLISIFISTINQNKRILQISVYFFLFPLLIIYFYPVYTNGIIGTSNLLTEKDIRLRVKKFPEDYYRAEEYLSKQNYNKAIYIPYGMGGSYLNEFKFNGPFKEAIDPFAAFSIIPGSFVPSDRPSTNIEYLKYLETTENLIDALEFSPVNYFILRKDIEGGASSQIIDEQSKYFKEDRFKKVFDSISVDIYKRNQDNKLIYIPKKILLTAGPISNLDEKNRILRNKYDSYINLDQNKTGLKFINELSNVEDKKNTKLDYNKINPTQYIIRVSTSNEKYPIIFNESFSKGWILSDIRCGKLTEFELYLNNFKNLLNKKYTNYVSNGFSNIWLVEGNENNTQCYSLVFYPQLFFQIGIIVSIIISTCIILLSILLLKKKN